mmetsp:Transcript_102540/g.258356  ORF Transcript_102540/g.258356 Transcript_102540/m.258356 type:complete len:324 (-) Transcript_102540:309-1280(-)
MGNPSDTHLLAGKGSEEEEGMEPGDAGDGRDRDAKCRKEKAQGNVTHQPQRQRPKPAPIMKRCENAAAWPVRCNPVAQVERQSDAHILVQHHAQPIVGGPHCVDQLGGCQRHSEHNEPCQRPTRARRSVGAPRGGAPRASEHREDSAEHRVQKGRCEAPLIEVPLDHQGSGEGHGKPSARGQEEPYQRRTFFDLLLPDRPNFPAGLLVALGCANPACPMAYVLQSRSQSLKLAWIEDERCEHPREDGQPHAYVEHNAALHVGAKAQQQGNLQAIVEVGVGEALEKLRQWLPRCGKTPSCGYVLSTAIVDCADKGECHQLALEC